MCKNSPTTLSQNEGCDMAKSSTFQRRLMLTGLDTATATCTAIARHPESKIQHRNSGVPLGMLSDGYERLTLFDAIGTRLSAGAACSVMLCVLLALRLAVRTDIDANFCKVF